MKKLFLSLLLLFFLFRLNSSAVFAQTTTNSNLWILDASQMKKAVTSPQGASLDQFIVSQGTGIPSLVGGMAAGFPPDPIVNAQGQITGYKYDGGAAGMFSNIAMIMMQEPGGASTKEYIADMGVSLGIIPKEAYAQGTGFASLIPLLQVWKITANITYALYVVIFFVIGFMILLRKKIDPRTVVTIESALPKLVITLILIALSYAIIGFMVDISNLISRIIAGMFIGDNKILFADPTVVHDSAPQVFDRINRANVFLLARPLGDVNSIVESIGNTAINVPIVGAITTRFIFQMSVLFITFRIFFALLGPYTGIVLELILAPFKLLLSAFPGNEFSVGSWFRSLLSKFAVFPVTFFLIILSASFGAYDSTQGTCSVTGTCFDWGVRDGLNSNLLKQSMKRGDLILNLLPMGNFGKAVGDLIAFGILFTIPSVAQLVQNAFKVKDQTADIASQSLMKQVSKLPFLKGMAG